jgi:hypothetical protein
MPFLQPPKKNKLKIIAFAIITPFFPSISYGTNLKNAFIPCPFRKSSFLWL